MRRYIVQANIDHYIDVLNRSDLAPQERSAVTALLSAELGKLGDDLEHLEFAWSRVTNGRDRVVQIRNLRNSSVARSAERELADRQLVAAENLLTLLEDFCHRLRENSLRAPDAGRK